MHTKDLNLIEVEDCIAWSAQQSYYRAEESAKELSKITGRQMYCDQPYYNSFCWKEKDPSPEKS